MDLIRMAKANRVAMGLPPTIPHIPGKGDKKKEVVPPMTSTMPSPYQELQQMKAHIIEKKPKNKEVRDYFEKLVEYRNGRAEEAEREAEKE